MTATIEYGLLALAIVSGVAAVYTSMLICRRPEVSRRARRALIRGEIAKFLAVLAALAALFLYARSLTLGLVLVGFVAFFLVLKFIFTRQYAHQLQRDHTARKQSPRTRDPSPAEFAAKEN